MVSQTYASNIPSNFDLRIGESAAKPATSLTVCTLSTRDMIAYCASAVHQHFAQKYSKYRSENGEPHADEWTLKFLGKVICEFLMSIVHDK